MGARAGGKTLLAGLAVTAALTLGGCQSGIGTAMFGDDASVGLFAGSQKAEREKGKAYFRAANFGLAEETFRSVLARNPKDAEAWVGLAASYDRLGRFDLADKAYGHAVAIAGRLPEIVNDMAYSQMLRGEHVKAATLFAEARRLAPQNPVIAANAALVKTL